MEVWRHGGLEAWRSGVLEALKTLKAWKPGGWRPPVGFTDEHQRPVAIVNLEDWMIQKHMEGLGS